MADSVTLRNGSGVEIGVAGNPVVVTGGGGGTQYADGDAVPSPTTGTVALGTDGTNLQAVKTDSDGNLQADILTIAAGDNNIGNVDVVSSALPTGASTSAKQDTIIGHLDGVEGLLTTIDGDTGTIAGAVSGTEMQVDVVASLPAGTNNIGDVDILSIAAGDNNIGNVDIASAIPAGTNNIGQVSVAPQTSNGLSVFNATSSDGATALTNSAQAIKASAGQLYGWYIYNPNSSAQFVQLYNTAAASVTVGTTNPLFMLTIPATSAANVEFTNGITFSNAGWSCAATSTAGGNGAPSTALDAVFFFK